MTLHSCRSCFIIVIACCNFSLGLATAYDTLAGPVDDIPLKEDRRVQSHISHSVGKIFVMLYYFILYYITLYCIILLYTVLYCNYTVF